VNKTLITLLAFWTLAGMSFAATKKRHATHSAKSRAVKTGARTKGKARRTSTARASRSRQAAPSPERYKEIQQALASKGYYKGEVNGEWGPDSVEALRRFQSAQSLGPDGKLGSLSLIALGLGPKRITAQARPEPQTVAPNQANQSTQSKQ
jgi:peptidoglycan hydrolase-like protein with peptidoglycan-binding domain